MARANLKKAFSLPGHTPAKTKGGGESLVVEPLIHLSPSDIDFYSGDVRIQENASYADIKASIKVEGLDNPITVARHPETNRWMVYGGGNSRLRACQELRLKSIPCRELVWVSDADAMVRHLRENDLRNGYSFIERCLAVEQLVKYLSASGKKLTVTAFVKYLSACGYPASSAKKLYLYYPFVLLTLQPLLPQALKGGLGANAVGTLNAEYTRATHGVSEKMAQKINALFFECLKSHDAESFPLQKFLTDFRAALEVAAPASAKKATRQREEARKAPLSTDRSKGGQPKAIVHSVEQLREMMHHHACDLAASIQFERCIVKIDFGMGFLVGDFLDMRYVKKDRRYMSSWIWWQLVSLSDAMHAPREVKDKLLTEIPECYTQLLAGNFEPAYTALDFPDPGEENFVVVRVLDDKCKTLYLALLALYWEAFHAATEVWPNDKETLITMLAEHVQE